jgi:hypothetical protein
MSTKTTKTESQSLAETVAEMIAFIEKVERLLPDTSNMHAAAKRRMPKPRRGNERVIATVANLAQTHGLDSPSLHSTAMIENMDRVRLLMPLETRLTALSKRVSDLRFLEQTQAWSSALQFWALLRRRAPTNSQLAVTIADLEQFFSYRNPKVIAEKPTKLQTRAKAQLAHAQELVAHARDRVGAIDATPVAPVANAPSPIAPIAAAPPPVVAPPVVAPVVGSPQSVRYTNGSNGASTLTNGAANGSGLTQGNQS